MVRAWEIGGHRRTDVLREMDCGWVVTRCTPRLPHLLRHAQVTVRYAAIPAASSTKEKTVTEVPMTPEATFARRMREQRREVGMTQVELARRLSEQLGVHVDATAITKIESGARAVRLDEAVYIAQLLNVPIWALVSDLDPADARMEELQRELEQQRARAESALREHEDALREITRLADEVDEIDAVTRRHAESANQGSQSER